jgi:proline iminopeptidase
MRASSYLGDLGGLSAHRQLILLDLRGTGQSAIPADHSSYRCDRLVDDISRLQDHLRLDHMDVLAHSAGANLALQYAALHPQQVNKLVLVGPSTRAVGFEISSEMRREIIMLRQGEPWGAEALAAFDRIQAGTGTDDDGAAIGPLWYAQWDDTAKADDEASDEQVNREAAKAFGSEGAFDPEATRSALATVSLPVLVLIGELDVNTPPRVASEVAALFSQGKIVVGPGVGHALPWLDDRDWFISTVVEFLSGDSSPSR